MNITTRTKLLEKILPYSKDNKIFNIDNIKHMQAIYNHNENYFQVNLISNNKGNLNEISELSYNVDKYTFIKKVLTSFSAVKPQENLKPKKVVIDFSSPNIAKPFHAGHLRSTIIGNFIANINKYYNHEVIKLNYLGDWGTQFGLLWYGLQDKKISINELKKNPMKTLYDVYVYANKLSSTDNNVHLKAVKYFSDIENGRTDLKDWKEIREITLQELEKVYQRLGINFDAYHWESNYNGKAIQELMNLLEIREIIKSDDSGKKVASINSKNITILKSDNSSLYISRDIAALLDRYNKYNFDKMLYVVDNAQTDHFAAVFQIVKQINAECTKGCEHIKFGRIKGMSTRTGNVVFLNDILDEAKQKMFEKQKQSKNTRSSAINAETCDILGTSAVIINDLKQRRQKDYTFSWDKALQSEGDSGIKLQYLHCRLWSLEQNCGTQLPEICEPSLLSENVIGDVVAELAKFEFILHKALVEYEACVIVNYLFRLARHINKMFNELRVKNVNSDLAAQRLLVFYSSRFVVKTCLEILGLRPLYKM